VADCRLTTVDGLPIGTASDAAAQLLDLSIRSYFSMSSAPYDGVGDATMIADAALQHDPEALLGLVIKLAVPLLGAPQVRVSDEELLSRARRIAADGGGSPWERAHLEVIEALLAGQSDRVDEMLFRIIEEYPRDLMAVRLSFVFSGPDKNTRLLRNARVTAANFDEAVDPVMHGFVQSELAYALEECGLYEEAEAIALESYGKNGGDSWAAHQVAHVHEMTGRGVAGAAFMKRTFEDWRSGGLAGHNMWHWALMLVDAGEREEALELLEGPILEYHGNNLVMGLQDIASLLYRLMLDADDPTVDAADLAEHWQTMTDAIADAGVLGKPTMSASMDVHIAMVLSSAGRYDALKEQIAIMGEYDPATVTARFLEARETSTAISKAMNAHGQGDFAGAARLLRSLDIERCAAKQ
jgi:hypothetical protein